MYTHCIVSVPLCIPVTYFSNHVAFIFYIYYCFSFTHFVSCHVMSWHSSIHWIKLLAYLAIYYFSGLSMTARLISKHIYQRHRWYCRRINHYHIYIYIYDIPSFPYNLLTFPDIKTTTLQWYIYICIDNKTQYNIT